MNENGNAEMSCELRNSGFNREESRGDAEYAEECRISNSHGDAHGNRMMI